MRFYVKYIKFYLYILLSYMFIFVLYVMFLHTIYYKNVHMLENLLFK